MNKYKIIVILYLFCQSFQISVRSQSVLKLNLNNTIILAADSSLASFKAKNVYLSSYWEFNSYKASKLPQISLNTIPFDYNRALVKRYNSQLNIDEYKQQQSIYSYLNSSITQKLPLTGGTIYIDSEIDYMNNMGVDGYTQFRTVPVRVGIDQKIFGFNSFKWQKKIEPIKYEKNKKELVKSTEAIAIQSVDYYFSLILAQMQLEIAKKNLADADTLYNIGLKRLAIASITQSDVLTLKVDVLNANNSVSEAIKNLQKCQFGFNSFLRLPENQQVELEVPDIIFNYQINLDSAIQLAQENDPDLLNFKQQRLEAAMNLEKTKRDNRFQAAVNASFGYNQQASTLSAAYQNPMNQQRFMVTFSIPLVDWGQNRGKYKMAKRNLDVVNLNCEQLEVDFRQDVMIAVTDLNSQFTIVKNLLDTRDVAKQAYETTKQRFLLGKVDVNALSLALNRQDQATINYLNSLYLYWKYYYNVRKLTLFDFDKGTKLTQNIDDILK